MIVVKYTTMNLLEKLFGSRIRSKLLAWFYTHSDEEFFVRQLAVILNEDPTNLSRELKNLEALGILTSERRGNLKHFRAEKKCAFYEELKGLVFKTSGIAGQLKTELRGLSGIEYAFIYGSFARGEENSQSDIDVMIIGSPEVNTLDSLIADIEGRLGRTINYVMYDLSEFAEKKHQKDGFITDVVSGAKIMLTGDEHELEAA